MSLTKVHLDTLNKDIYVSSNKVNYIKNIVDCASLCNKIDAIILFGSALEERCTDDSDIDIVIVSKYTVTQLEKLKSFNDFINSIFGDEYIQEYDILYMKSLSEIKEKSKQALSIYSEINKKGTIIYKREM